MIKTIMLGSNEIIYIKTRCGVIELKDNPINQNYQQKLLTNSEFKQKVIK